MISFSLKPGESAQKISKRVKILKLTTKPGIFSNIIEIIALHASKIGNRIKAIFLFPFLLPLNHLLKDLPLPVPVLLLEPLGGDFAHDRASFFNLGPLGLEKRGPLRVFYQRVVQGVGVEVFFQGLTVVEVFLYFLHIQFALIPTSCGNIRLIGSKSRYWPIWGLSGLRLETLSLLL